MRGDTRHSRATHNIWLINTWCHIYAPQKTQHNIWLIVTWQYMYITKHKKWQHSICNILYWKSQQNIKNYNQSFFIYIRCPFEGLNIVNYKFIDCTNWRCRENILYYDGSTQYYHEITKKNHVWILFKKA